MFAMLSVGERRSVLVALLLYLVFFKECDCVSKTLVLYLALLSYHLIFVVRISLSVREIRVVNRVHLLEFFIWM